MPSYQSIGTDLEQIADHNDRARRYSYVAEKIDKLRGNDAQPPSSQRMIYERARFNQVLNRVIDGIFKDDGHRRLLDPSQRRLAKDLIDGFENWSEKQGIETLIEFDIYFRTRRLFSVTYAISALLNGHSHRTLTQEEKSCYRKLWRRLNQRIKLLEIVQSRMEYLLDLYDFKWVKAMKEPDGAAKIWGNVRDLLRGLLDPRGFPDLPPLGVAVEEWPSEDEYFAAEKEEQLTLYQQLDARIQGLLNSTRSTSHTSQTPTSQENSLLLVTDAQELAIFKEFAPAGESDEITQRYCGLTARDMVLFPLQYMANLQSPDEIRMVRISPIDAQLGFCGDEYRVDRKLSGDELGHFGGFLKSSWRANDLMWGRLDGACKIIQSVLTYEKLAERFRGLTTAQLEEITSALEVRCPNSTSGELLKLKVLLEMVSQPVAMRNPLGTGREASLQ